LTGADSRHTESGSVEPSTSGLARDRKGALHTGSAGSGAMR
jgi:hypothetical protein